MLAYSQRSLLQGEVILRWLEWAQRRAHGEGLGWRKWISEYGYERPVGPEERTAIEDNAIDEPNLEEVNCCVAQVLVWNLCAGEDSDGLVTLG